MNQRGYNLITGLYQGGRENVVTFSPRFLFDKEKSPVSVAIFLA